MLFRENQNSPPLKQPFISFPIPQRPTSAKSHHSELLTHQPIKQSPSNYSINRNTNSEVGEDSIHQQENRTNYLLQLNKQICRIKIDEDAAYLRQQMWIQIQLMFRKIWSYGEEFYDIVQKMIMQIQQHTEFYQNCQGNEALIYKSILRNLEKQQGLYSKDRMLKINSRIIEKVSNYFEELTEKYVDSLFHFSSEAGLFTENQMQREYFENKVSTEQKWEHKQEAPKITINWNRKQAQIKSDEYFQSCYDEIKNNQIKNRTFRSENLNSRMYTQPVNITQKNHNDQNKEINPYGLILQTGKFIEPQATQQFEYSQMEYSNSKYYSRQCSNGFEGRRNGKTSQNKISTSPVISRVKLGQEKQKVNNTNIVYEVDSNKQGITSEWCQQIKISADIQVKNIPINGMQDGNQSHHNNNTKIVSTTFCNNFQHLVFGTTSSIIFVLDSRTFSLVSQLVGHAAPVCCLFQHQGLLFSGGDVGCSSIYIWDTRNWTVMSKLCYHSAAVCSIIGIPNTDYLLSCSMDKTIKLYNYQKFLITDHHSSSTPYTKLVYFEDSQKLAVSSPGTTIDIFNINLSKQEDQLTSKNGIMCSDKISTIQKSNGLLLIGLQNGLIELHNIIQGVLIKRVTAGKSAIMNIISFNRCHKNDFPILLFSCFGCRNFYTLNTETQFISEANVKGNVNVLMSCGIGPINVVSNRFQLLWIDQEQPRVYLTSFSIH